MLWKARSKFGLFFRRLLQPRTQRRSSTSSMRCFSPARPTGHAALAARIHELSPEAFQGLASAMKEHAAKIGVMNPEASAPSALATSQAPEGNAGGVNPPLRPAINARESASAGPSETPAAQKGAEVRSPSAAQTPDSSRAAQIAFYHSTNAAVVRKIVA